MRRAAVVLSVLSAVLWALSGLATWAAMDHGALSMEANGACAVTILAGMCWVTWAVRDRDKDVLVDAWATLSSRRALAETRPERILRRVS